jgi:type IV pilus assembly protein PilQ
MTRNRNLITGLALSLAFLAAPSALGEDAKTAAPNVIEALDVSTQPGKVTVRLSLKQPLTHPPVGFTLNNPPRIALDFPGTSNGLGRNSQDINQGDLRQIRLGQSGGRTRVVLNLTQMAAYDTQLDGNSVVVTLQAASAATAATPTEPIHFATPVPAGSTHSIRDIDFRRGRAGEAQVIVELSDSATGIDLRQQGRNIIVDFLRTALPPALERRYDVTDFGTPVEVFDLQAVGGNVRLTVAPRGRWEQAAYQADNRFIIEVKPVVEDARRDPTAGAYQGEKLSLNFQNIEVRSVLQVLADFTGLNIITSDTVRGDLTLRLKDVPWDQALDIILQAKGLDMRKTGNVIWIAPRDEIATREKLLLEAQQQIADLEPMRTEAFQMNYQRAEDLKKLITDANQKMLSRRGTAVVDSRTNTIFVQDIEDKLSEVRDLIKRIDVQVRQVLIEARIVEASDTFSQNIGVRLGMTDLTALRGGGAPGFSPAGGTTRMLFGGNLSSVGVQNTQTPDTGSSFIPDSFNVNLAAPGLAGNAPGTFSLSVFNSKLTRFLNLEITALQADGKGKIVSSPRVITADNVEATIEQGTEIPYQQATSSGATAVSFRKATLSLKVKPQITPDDNVIMQLDVHKDSVGQNTAAGPSIDTKQVTTEVLVENGGTVGIGGIYEQEETTTITKVPLLGDLPLLGRLFRQDLKRNDKRELLIFITPRIMTDRVTAR